VDVAMMNGELDSKLRPATEYGRVSKDRYVSRAFADAEAERLWPRVWLHAAPLDLLAAAGQFVTVELAGGDVLLIRGHDDRIRAFHNVCLHRGRKLVDEPCGLARTLRCPLHHWQWNTDGSLARVPDREVFGSLVDDTLGLRPLACEAWGGQAWVHFGAPQETLIEWLAPAVKALEPYELERYALLDLVTFDVPCNWKTGADQFNEAYHVHTAHPYLLGSVDDTNTSFEVHGPHVQQVFTIGRPSPRLASNEVTESLADLLRQNGVAPESLGGDATRAPAALRAAMRARGIDRLTDEELLTGRSWYLFPSLTFNAYAHMLMMHRYRPHRGDHERMWLDQLTFTRLDGNAQRPVPETRSFKRPGEGSGGPVIEDDVSHLIALQQGMRSPGFEAVRLGGHERCALHMHATIDRYLGR
jgi:phenylpropionate dioxygenase-like ring-hydroxylating dioxygenase large terminal subunit